MCTTTCIAANTMPGSEEISLPGGGAMGAAVRAFDWNATPLGAIRTWPSALRHTVVSMLNSPESLYLVWGPS